MNRDKLKICVRKDFIVLRKKADHLSFGVFIDEVNVFFDNEYQSHTFNLKYVILFFYKFEKRMRNLRNKLITLSDCNFQTENIILYTYVHTCYKISSGS